MADTEIEVGRAPAPALRRPTGVDVIQSFRDEMDRMFDQFWRGFGLPAFGRFGPPAFWRGEPSFEFTAPSVDAWEDEKAYHIAAELPGMSEKDINIMLSGDRLTISAAKTEEKEEEGKSYHFSERHTGAFRRSLFLPEGIDRDRIDASLKSGVLAITLPKTSEVQQQQKKIEVKSK